MTNANVFDQRIFQNIFAVFSLWKYRKKLKISLPSILIMIKHTITVNFIHKSSPILMQNARHMIRNEHFASILDETYEWN